MKKPVVQITDHAQVSDRIKPWLPGVLGLIATDVDEAAAVRLARARGGRCLYIPAKVRAGDTLSQIVGLDAAERIARLLGPGSVLVPCGSIGGAGGRRARIAALWHAGLSHAEIAAEVDVHARTVDRVVARLRAGRAPELPFRSDPDRSDPDKCRGSR